MGTNSAKKPFKTNTNKTHQYIKWKEVRKEEKIFVIKCMYVFVFQIWRGNEGVSLSKYERGSLTQHLFGCEIFNPHSIKINFK